MEGIYAVLVRPAQFDTLLHVSMTFTRIFLGAVLSIAIALLLGVYMGINEAIEEWVAIYVFIILTVPSVVWAFLAIMWFGRTKFLVPVFVIVLIVVPYLTLNIWEGTKAVDDNLLEMARAFDQTDRDIWQHIYLPHLTPYLFTSTRLAFAISWKICLIAELFGTSTGIGVVVNNHFHSFDPSMVIAWAVPVMTMMFGIERGLHRLEKRTYVWKPDAPPTGTGR